MTEPIYDAPSLWELLERRAEATPNRVMLIDDTDRSVTFAQFKDRAERVASGLRELGVTEGTPVTWILPTRIETIELSFALSRLGAVQNPIIHIYRHREVGFCIRQTGAQLVVHPGVWGGFDYGAMIEEAVVGLDRAPQVLVAYDTLPEGDAAGLPAPPAPDTDAVRWLYYTSGTTSDPKGVKHTDRSLIAGGIGLARALQMSGDDVGSIAFPYAHIGGPDYIVTMLSSGFGAVLVERFDPATAVTAYARHGVTMAGGSTAFYQMFLTQDRKSRDAGRGPAMPTLRLMTGGGAPKPPEIYFQVKAQMGIPAVHGYGMTECPMISQGTTGDSDDQLAHTDGGPVHGCEVSIVTADGAEAPAGTEGEVRVRGPMLFAGYTDPALDADACDEQGRFRTGDLAVMRSDGHITLTGRLKDIIIRKGENISPKEIEDVLYAHPKVNAAAVVGLPDPERGEVVCAVVETATGRDDLSFSQMVDACRSAGLARQKVPERLEIHPGPLPRNATLKILKHKLRETYTNQFLRLWAAALAVLLVVSGLSPAGAAANPSRSGSPPSAACISPGCLTFQGNLVWEASMTLEDTGAFLAYGGPLTDSGFSWRGATYTVLGVFLARPLSDPETSYVSISFQPELPAESRDLQLRIGGSGLNLVDGDFGNGHFLWVGVDLDWRVGETVTVGLREFPPQLEPRSMDGRGNNFHHPTRGMAGTAQLKIAPTSYTDGVSTPTASWPNPRTISNLVSSQQGSVPNSSGASDIVWQWGQFLDHDIVLSPDNPAEPFPIPVPQGDRVFDPAGTGQAVISLNRSASDPGTGTDMLNPRRQTNAVTAFIDASQVYGPEGSRALALRTSDGTGRLKTSHEGRLLPFNEQGLQNDGGRDLESLFVAGDVRANEHVGLTAMHTLFVREHNRLADIIADQDPDLSGDEIYQLARKIVGAQNQAITFNEFLPLLLAPDAIAPYSGYDPSVDPAIASEFSAAAFRVGHSMLSPNLLLIGADGQEEQISLARSFFNPSFVVEHGISALLRGLAAQPAQQVNSLVIDEVRNMLLREPNGPAFDLAALNIQRGRDHGVGDYNTVRRAYGLAPVESLADISSDPSVQQAVMHAYDDIGNLDLWTAALAEDHVPGAMVGETLQTIISDQFRRLRDGDRFWFENDPYFLANPGLLDEVRSTTLADIIRHNTPIEDEIQDNVFIVESSE